MSEETSEKTSEEISEKAIRKQIVKVCKRLYRRNMLAAADGNVSFRLRDNRIFITPSGINKAFMKPDDMSIIDIDEQILEGNPSSERKMHLQIYRTCPMAKCVVHAHPPTAIAWSIAQPQLSELPSNSLSEVILAVGAIPFVPYARPGTEEMGEKLMPFLPQHRAMILSRHGALTWGEDIDEAANGMERIEHSCEILARAEGLGGITDLPSEEVSFLKKMRKNLGERIL